MVTVANGCNPSDEVTVRVIDVRCGSIPDKVELCHNSEEICVATSAVEAHLNHCDMTGSCNYKYN